MARPLAPGASLAGKRRPADGRRPLDLAAIAGGGLVGRRPRCATRLPARPPVLTPPPVGRSARRGPGRLHTNMERERSGRDHSSQQHESTHDSNTLNQQRSQSKQRTQPTHNCAPSFGHGNVSSTTRNPLTTDCNSNPRHQTIDPQRPFQFSTHTHTLTI